MAERGVFPGSFNPPTIAHVAVADAARASSGLDRVDLVLSRSPLAKEHVDRPLVEHRLAVLERLAARVRWLGATITDHQLLVDIAGDFDLLIIGADKWHQLRDPSFYGDSEHQRDNALRRLPPVAIAPRPPWEHPDADELAAAGIDGVVLDLGEHLAEVSSSVARDGARDLMVPEAVAFDDKTGAWSDPERYERWLAGATSSHEQPNDRSPR